HDLRYIEQEDLEVLTGSSGYIVLAGGLPWKLRAHIRKWCVQHDIPCHDVTEQGAFQLEGLRS
ncbi:MAG TPA: hypothetical protein PLL57_16360, partial [Flavobacteriales bacterium]|nr:hypothetical protein [Flavobacteriales bacterium]